VKEHDLVLSMDGRVIKMWNEDTGKPFAAIEPGNVLNDFVRYPDSGMVNFFLLHKPIF
jgi:ribosome biogenesis protein ENP2